jgi:hypothetical protein
VHGGVDVDGLRAQLTQFRRAQPQVAVRLSQPAGLHELLEGKVDVLIEGSLRRHPGYRCDPLEDGFLIAPLGTADCPEVETLRCCLLALSQPSTVPRRSARSRLTA